MKVKIELSEQQQKEKTRLQRLQKKFLGYLHKEGPYKFAQLVRELAGKDDRYIEQHYEVPNAEHLGQVLEGVFGMEYGYQMTTAEYLEKVRTLTNFMLAKPVKNA